MLNEHVATCLATELRNNTDISIQDIHVHTSVHRQKEREREGERKGGWVGRRKECTTNTYLQLQTKGEHDFPTVDFHC